MNRQQAHNSKDSPQRYFIAILPTAGVSGEVRQLQENLMEEYNTKAALRSPPHITLHMPFGWKESRENELIAALKSFFIYVKPFKVFIEGLGAFPPRVIFMNVRKTAELASCQHMLSRYCRSNLGLFNALFGDEAYHPHLTLAFRDLRKPAFLAAWEIYGQKTFSADFTVQHIHLLKHDGKEWKPHYSFELSSSL